MNIWSYTSSGLSLRDSCFAPQQRLRCAKGTASAEDLYSALLRGERPILATYDPVHAAPLELVGGCRTVARGRRIHFADGATVSLTDGHVLRHSTYETRRWSEETLQCDVALFARDVEVGMALGGRRVTQIDDSGTISAIRLWTDRPEWLVTDDGIVVGSRWHEVLSAWGVAAANAPINEVQQCPETLIESRGYVRSLDRSPWDSFTALGSVDHMIRCREEFVAPLSELDAAGWISQLAVGFATEDDQYQDTSSEHVVGTLVGPAHPGFRRHNARLFAAEEQRFALAA